MVYEEPTAIFFFLKTSVSVFLSCPPGTGTSTTHQGRQPTPRGPRPSLGTPQTIALTEQALDALRRQPPMAGTLVVPSPPQPSTSPSGSSTGTAVSTSAPSSEPHVIISQPGSRSSEVVASGLITLRPLDPGDDTDLPPGMTKYQASAGYHKSCGRLVAFGRRLSSARRRYSSTVYRTRWALLRSSGVTSDFSKTVSSSPPASRLVG